MGKHSKRSPRRSTPSDTNNRQSSNESSDNDNDNLPKWDTSPNSLPGWLVSVGEKLLDEHEFNRLITLGWVTDRKDICCASQNHIDIAFRQLIVPGTAASPCMIGPTSFQAFTADTLVAPPQYKEMPEVIDRVDKEMLTVILKAIPDKDTKDELRTIATGSSGRRALVELHSQKQKVLLLSANYGQSLANDFDKIEKAGIGHASCKDYSAFKSNLNEIRKQLPADRAILDGTFAGKLINAVRLLGAEVARALDVEIRLTSARGDLKKVDAAIRSVLATIENDTTEGLGFAARPDPKRAPGGPGNPGPYPGTRPPWQPSKGRCPNCKILDKDGKRLKGDHWKSDCTKGAEAEREKAKRAAAKAKEESDKAPPSSGAAEGRGNLAICSASEDDTDDESPNDTIFVLWR